MPAPFISRSQLHKLTERCSRFNILQLDQPVLKIGALTDTHQSHPRARIRHNRIPGYNGPDISIGQPVSSEVSVEPESAPVRDEIALRRGLILHVAAAYQLVSLPELQRRATVWTPPKLPSVFLAFTRLDRRDSDSGFSTIHIPRNQLDTTDGIRMPADEQHLRFRRLELAPAGDHLRIPQRPRACPVGQRVLAKPPIHTPIGVLFGLEVSSGCLPSAKLDKNAS